MGRLRAVKSASLRFEMARKWLEKDRPLAGPGSAPADFRGRTGCRTSPEVRSCGDAFERVESAATRKTCPPPAERPPEERCIWVL